MSDWDISDGLFRLGVLAFAAIAFPTLVRRWVGGNRVSYTALTSGFVLLLVGEVFRLATEWGALNKIVNAYLPTHIGGYLLVVMGFLLLMRDMRQRQKEDQRAAEAERERAAAARLQEAKLQAVLDGATDYSILTCDLAGRITSYSNGGANVLGWKAEEVVGKMNVADFRLPNQGPSVADVMETADRQGLCEAEVLMCRKDGRTIPVLLTVTPLRDAEGRPEGYVRIAKDITAIKEVQVALRRANEELQRLATTDGLTGLVNRRQALILFEREIARSRRNNSPLGVVLMDLDHFKAVNDTYGHEAGDAVLKEIARGLRERLRATDVFARYGGEEFLLILPETDLDKAAYLAEVVRRRVEETAVTCGNTRIRLSASLGVAVLEPGRNLSADGLISQADEAMYQAKNLGRNRVATAAPAAASPSG